MICLVGQTGEKFGGLANSEEGKERKREKGREMIDVQKEEGGRRRRNAEGEYVFLKRKPRIFLVGNPKKLGYNEEDGRLTKDSSGIDWYNAINTVNSMIFAERDIPYGIRALWIEETLYYVESPKILVRYDEQGYQEFYELIKQIEDTETKESIKALFEYTEPIKVYEIPNEKTDERVWFNRAVKMREELEKDLEILRNKGMKR